MSMKNTAAQKSQKKEAAPQPTIKVIADNRRARHEYEILETFETGIQLAGTEVKSMRLGKANLQDAFARIEGGELWLYNCHISPYEFGNRFNHDPVRRRRLLMHRKQILRIHQQVKEKGLTLVPLKLYFKRNWVKVDLALAKGKQLYDKRETIAKRDSKRQLDRLVRQNYRGS
jgi:SsrA-binding protein